jgi:CTP:molybdopterin cytidylyltransferase MocA
LPEEAEAAVVVLADGPDLDPRAVDRVVDDWRANGGDAVAATYGGVRLHPVLLARGVWGAVPEEGAKSLPARLVPCDDLTPPGDVDTAIPAGS